MAFFWVYIGTQPQRGCSIADVNLPYPSCILEQISALSAARNDWTVPQDRDGGTIELDGTRRVRRDTWRSIQNVIEFGTVRNRSLTLGESALSVIIHEAQIETSGSHLDWLHTKIHGTCLSLSCVEHSLGYRTPISLETTLGSMR